MGTLVPDRLGRYESSGRLFLHRLPERVAPFKHYLIGANWSVDQREDWFGYGFSVILAPDGKVLASAKSLYGSEIIYATIKTAWAKD